MTLQWEDTGISNLFSLGVFGDQLEELTYIYTLIAVQQNPHWKAQADDALVHDSPFSLPPAICGPLKSAEGLRTRRSCALCVR